MMLLPVISSLKSAAHRLVEIAKENWSLGRGIAQ
jgi:hypothetical protein